MLKSTLQDLSGRKLEDVLPLNSSTVCLEVKVDVAKGVELFTASSTGFISKRSRWGGDPTQPFVDEKGPFRHSVREVRKGERKKSSTEERRDTAQSWRVHRGGRFATSYCNIDNFLETHNN